MRFTSIPCHPQVNGLPYTTMHLSPLQAAPEMSAKVSAKRLHTAQHSWTTLDNTGTPGRLTGRNTPYIQSPKRHPTEFDSPSSPPRQRGGKTGPASLSLTL